MARRQIEKSLRDISTLASRVGRNDLEAMGRIHVALEEMGDWDEGPATFRASARDALHALDRVILREISFESGMPAVAEGIRATAAALEHPAETLPAGSSAEESAEVAAHVPAAPQATAAASPDPSTGPAEQAAASPAGEVEVEASLAGQYLAFWLGDEEYAVDILSVREIIGLPAVTRVPRTPPYVKGVINLRGQVVPVVDLRQRFGLPVVAPTAETCIIVIDHDAQLRGFLVDRVSEVLTITDAEITPAPDFGGTIDATFIRGIGKAGQRVRILLAIEEVFTAAAAAGTGESSAA